MKTRFCLSLLLTYVGLTGPAVLAQSVTLSGILTGEKKEPLAGVNVLLKGTYDGASTDTNGVFSFQTDATGRQSVVASLVGYASVETAVDLAHPAPLTIRLNEVANELNTVVVTGGSFNIGESKRMMMLKPLDILTTPGANADIVAAVQMLPGSQKVGETEGLFVRGGAATETRTFVDDALIQNPFFSSGPDVAARSRFSTAGFLFKGTSFGKGGYSAQYGQALSSILVLDTQDTDPMPGLTTSLNVAGASVTAAKEYGKFSFWQNTYYNNLTLLFRIVPQNVNWLRAPESLGNTFLLRYKPNARSVLKLYGSLTGNRSALLTGSGNSQTVDPQPVAYRIGNANYVFNLVYKATLGHDYRWTLKALAGHSNNIDRISIGPVPASRTDALTQAKVSVSRAVGELSSVLAGAEVQQYDYSNQYDQLSRRFSNRYVATFAEGEWYLTRKLAIKAGVRQEYASLNGRMSVSPRVSAAYKTGPYSQVSGAFGQFYQLPNNQYLLTNHALNFEKAVHYLANFEYAKDRRSFRIEAYQKTYGQLVRERVTAYDANPYRFPTGPTANTGYGYAKGLDVFVKDSRLMANTDLWVSYSLIDTKRLFANYLTEVTPTFVSTHNLNVVYKRSFPGIRTSVGVNYALSSGRPYYSPSFESFRGRTYHNVSVNANYLTSLRGHFTVFYVSADNIFNIHNVYTYRFAADGSQPTAVVPPTYRTVFAGMSITFHKQSSTIK